MTDAIDYDKLVNDAVSGTATDSPAAPVDYDALVGNTIEQEKRQRFLETLQRSKDVVPERQARAIEVAKLRGVPVGVAYQYLDELAPKADAPSYDDLAQRAPETAKLLSDPVKGPVTFTDYEPLSAMEQAMRDLGTPRSLGAQKKPGPIMPLDDQIFGAGSTFLTPEQQKTEQDRLVREAATAAQAAAEAQRQAQIIADNERRWREQNDPSFAYGGANYNPNTDLTKVAAAQEAKAADAKLATAQAVPPTQSAWMARFNAARRTLAGGVTSAAQGLSALADSLDYWLPVGSPKLDKNGRSDVTNYFASFPEYWAQLFPEDKARASDLSVRATEAIASGVPFMLGGAAAKAAGVSPGLFAALYGAMQQAGQGEADAVANGAGINTKNLTTWINALLGASEAVPVEALFATMASGGTRSLSQFLSATASNAAIEAGQNVAQQVPADLWAKITYDPKRDVLGNAAEALKMGAIAGGFFGAVAGLAGSAAEQNHEKLLALGDAASKLKLADLAPQILDEHIAELKKSGAAPEHVTAPAEAVETLFQELAPEDITKLYPETVKALQEAKVTGAEVTIPTEELVRLGKLNGYKNFAADVRIGDEMTLNEVTQLRGDVEKYLASVDTAAPTAQEDSAIYKGLYDQLIKAGQTPDVATAQARLMDAFFSSQSERTGVPVADLARRYGVEITNSALDPKAMPGATTLTQRGPGSAFNEPAIQIDGQVMKASDVFPNWEKGSRPAGGDGMSIADEQALGDVNLGPGMPEDPFWGHAELRQLAAEKFGADRVNQQIESDPENGFGFVNAAGEFRSLKNLQATTTLNQDGAEQGGASTDGADVAETDNVTPNITPDVAPAVDASSLDAANTLSKSKTWDKGRQLKQAIQDVVVSALQKLGLDPIVRSSTSLHYLTQVGVKDALAALEQNPNAIGWYDVKTRQALAVMGLVHPEILKDENARFAFTWALAVTSNGIKVGKNFELADEVYRRFKADGRMPSDVKAGNAQAAINDSLYLFNVLRDRWGIDSLRKFMLTDFTVKEITGIDPELKPSGEAIDELVRGAAILGPKIGNGFFSNLYGNFDALTMDRWLVRTWGRWTGTLIELDLPNIENSRARLSEAVKGLDKEALATALRAVKKTTKTKGETEVKPGDREALISALEGDDLEALATAVNKASMEPKFRTAMNGVQGGEELRLAGNSLAKYLDGQKEQPGGKRITGPNERRYIREVFDNILATLRQDPRYAELKMADLQAVLWYAEKRLYETAKEDTVVQDGDVADSNVSGYEDEEAPDYANAAANRARQSGVSDRKINAALKREAENGRPAAARPGDAGTSGADGQAVARAEGGQQVPSRGFTGSEKRSFIQREALDRVRSNRVGDAEQSWSYAGGSGADGARPRVLKSLGVTYVAEWKAGKDLATIFRANGISTPPILELEQGSAKNAAQFVSAISAARDTLGPIGEAVKVYSPEEYAGMRLFVTKDGQSGFALKPDGDIVSVFSAKGAGNGRAVMETAIAAGGKKLDCFATILPDFYAAHGFRATSRLLWNDEIAMSDMPSWDKAAMAKFNNGEPDVVFMVYDPSFNGEYDRKGTPLKSGDNGYDLAVRAQERAVREVERAAANQASEPPTGGSSASGTTLNQGGKDVRGSITFSPLRDKFRITLTEKANLSTFLHEGGHFFLEVLQDLVTRGEASAQQVADLKTLKRWMAIEDGKAIDRNGHEKFARSFEAFLMEGKAPSLALHGIFQKFKAWMIFVYKRLANVRGELNDEIRAVMDRLVASDAAIAEARTMVGWRGQPMSQEETGLTDAEYKAYVGEWTKANDAQSADADARVMLEAARELKKTWTDEKNKVTREVEAELAQTRGWKAWKMLENGEGLQELRPGWSNIKIDPGSIPAEWRRDTKGLTAAPHEGGLPLDLVAETMGFDSGEQMLQAIGGARLAQKAIPARVRQIMVERHGEMDAAALMQEAMKAVHNKPTMDVLLTEFRALAAKANLKVGKDTKRMMKAAAEERVAQLTQRQLDPSKWRRAEVKAAEEAGKLAAKGRDTEAALAKRRQLMAAAMAKASLDAQDRIAAIKDYLSTFTTNRRRAALGKAGEAYLDQVDQILEAVQFKEVSLKAIKARQGLNEFVKEQEAAGEPVFISDATRNLLGRKNYSEMTLEELEGIHDAVKNLWTIAREINIVRKGQEKIALEQAIADITAETEATLPAKKQRDHLNPTRIDKMMAGLSRYHAGNLKIEFILDWLGKTAHSLIYQPISDASYQSWKTHRDLTAPFMEKLRNMPKEQRQRWNTKRQFMDLPMPVKGANIWVVALNLGNEGNKAKLLQGYGWSEAQLMAELNSFMTKEDWDLVQETWDTIDKMWPEMSRIVQKASGLAPPKVEAIPVDTPFGSYRGGYFPVVYDTHLDDRMANKLDSAISPEEMFQKRFTAFAINNGFTKGRTANVGKLLLSPDVIADHLGEVIHYVTHYEAVKQADKIMRSPEFRRLVKTHLGEAVYQQMKSWLRDVATNTTQKKGWEFGDSVFRWARTSAQLTALGLNIKSALKQPLGIITTLDALKAKHWAIGIQEAWLSPHARANWKEAFAKSKELGPLVKSYDRDVAAISRAYADKIGSRAKEAAYTAAFMPISVMQSVANVAAWRGAYSQGLGQGMSESDAINFADKIVRTTQGSGALKDLSGIQRGGEASKFLTMFYSYFSVLYNRMADVQVRERGVKNLHRKAGRYMVLLLLGELLNSSFDMAWDKMFPPDKKREEDDQAFLVRLGLNTIDSTINTLPGIRDLYGFVSAIASDDRPRMPPAIAMLEKASRGAAAVKDVTLEGKDLTRAKARNAAALIGIVTGLPVAGVYKSIDDLFGQAMFEE